MLGFALALPNLQTIKLEPAEQYKLIKRCDSYDRAQLWLLEDEYEPIEGRLSEAE
jgi:hypothetical protein